MCHAKWISYLCDVIFVFCYVYTRALDDTISDLF